MTTAAVAPVETTTEDPTVPARRWRTGSASPARRPVFTVLVVGVVYTLLQMWWVGAHRDLGAYNVDEEGGLAAALRFHRNVDIDPRVLGRVVLSTWNGPLVPLLSVPGLLVGSRTAGWAMLVQPLLVVAAACAVAGIIARLGHRRAAIVAGVVVLCIPISIESSRSYQYSSGVAAFLALALWALVASDRGRRRWPMLAFGAAVGAMVLCRTMAVGFVPGVVIATLLLVARERRVVWNLAAAVLVSLVVAGPWWFANYDAISEYLAVNAYGDRAHYWGEVSWSGRVDQHLTYFGNDFRMFFAVLVPLAVLAIGGFGVRRAARRAATADSVEAAPTSPDDAPNSSGRVAVALGVVVLAGFGALFSTSNVGFWFAHPLDVVLVAAVAAAALAIPLPPGPWARRALTASGTLAAGVAVVTFGLALTVTGGDGKREPRWREPFIGGHGELQGGNYEADPRMGSTSDAVRGEAAAEWLAASTALAHEIERLIEDNGPLIQTVTGEIHLLNSNTIALTQEVTGEGITGIIVNNTLEPPDSQLRKDLTPRVGETPRVLVIVEGRSLGFPNGRGWQRYRRLAIEEGWIVDSEIPLPDGGSVEVLVHPDSIQVPSASPGSR